MKKHFHTIKKLTKRVTAAAIAAVLCVNAAGAGPVSAVRGPAIAESVRSAFSVTAYADNRSATVNTDRLNVRSGPGTSYSKIATLGAGMPVTVTGETRGTDGYTWYSISFSGGSGYARNDLISVNTVYAASDQDFESLMNSQGFPESYKNGLRGLHQKYPNWRFTALQTGLDWNTAVAEESKIGRNLVSNSSISSWKSIQAGAFDWANNYWPGFDGATWVQASSELIAYYMDPRNFLSDPYIFQFEVQKYNPSIQTKDGLTALVSGTFLAGDAVVPVEGSVIEGGTVIEGSTYQPAGGLSYSGSGSSNVIGPGGSSSSGSSNVIGPGGNTGGYVIAGSTMGPGGSPAGTTGAGPGTAVRLISALDDLTGVITAYANWQKDADNKWVYYEKSTGSFLNDGWHWLDGNGDGIAECYYFYSDGSLAVSDTVEGYYVNADGQWIHTNGEVITKNVAADSAASSGSGSASDGVVISSAAPGDMPAGSFAEAQSGAAVGPAVSTDTAGTASGTAVYGPMGADGAVSTDTAASGQLKKVPYVDIIMKAAEESGVSPYVLASAIIQEQGKGTSDLVNGSSGYYNFYNIDAYEHDGMSAVAAGLNYAAQSGTGGRPWNTIEKAIIGGAKLYNANYVNNGQDTFYLKKFNVQGSNKYNHQFMTHVLAAASEGAKISNAYSDSFKAQTLEFRIPVYQNMPESTALPAGDGNPNNKLSALSVEGYQLTPTFNMDTESYSLIVDGSSAQVYINASAIDHGAQISGAGYVALNVGGNEINVTVRAQNGSERVYRLSITRRDNVGDGGAPAMVSGAAAESPAGTVGGQTVYGPGSFIAVPSDGAVISNPSGPGTAAVTDRTAAASGGSAAGGSDTVIIGAGPM